MAILRLSETDGRDIEVSENANVRVQRRYDVLSSIPNEEEGAVRLAEDPAGNRLPAIFAPHPTRKNLRCVSVKPTQEVGDPYLWRVVVQWASIQLASRARGQPKDPDQRNENPLLRPAILRFGNAAFQRPLRKDAVTGAAILNSAGDPFDPPVMTDDMRPTLSITKNIPRSAWNVQTWLNLHNVTNDKVWLTAEKGRVKLVSMTGDDGYENGIPFVTKVGTFHFATDADKNDWKARPVQAGFHELVTVTYTDPATGLPATKTVKQEILLRGGAKPTTAVRLDPFGQRAPDDAPADATVYAEFNALKPYNFDSLGFF